MRMACVNNFTEYPDDLPSFPTPLHDAGYATAYIGKWHMGEDNDSPRPGFDYFATHKGQGKYFDTEFNINGARRKVMQRLLHERRHRPGHRLAQKAAVTAGKPWLLCSATRRRTASTRPKQKYAHAFDDVRRAISRHRPFISTTSRPGSSSGCPPGTASMGRCSSGARSSPTTGPRPSRTSRPWSTPTGARSCRVDDSVGRLLETLRGQRAARPHDHRVHGRQRPA